MLSVTAIPMALDPQEVFGAVTFAPADGNEDGTRCQRRTTLSLNPSGKKWQNPLVGKVCLLTTGVLISVRLGYPVGHGWVISLSCSHPPWFDLSIQRPTL